MKKLLMLTLICTIITSLIGCAGGDSSANYALVGTVSEIADDSITVLGTEGDATGVSYIVKLTEETSYVKNGASTDKSALSEGAVVTVTYNGMATRSIPAQINAIKIEMNENGESHRMRATVKAVESGIIRVDVTDAEYAYGEYIVHVYEETVILSASGEYIGIDGIKVGDTIDIIYGGQVTLSLPPQISAVKIRVN